MFIFIMHALPPLSLNTPVIDVLREIVKNAMRRDPPDTLRRDDPVNEEEMVRVD